MFNFDIHINFKSFALYREWLKYKKRSKRKTEPGRFRNSGKAGFEPTMPAPKTRALTTWRLPWIMKN